jgi:uncharacterized membrane protein YagU involved in acid resistance
MRCNQKHENSSTTHVFNGVLAGAAGGLAGAWVMNQFQTLLKKSSGSEENQQTQRQEESEPATAKAATAISQRVFHHRLSDQEKQVAAPAIHYGFGAAMGALYGAIAEIAPPAKTGFGLLYGVVLWLIADEAAVPALGLSKSPTQYPLSTHASALASHCAYATTTEAVRRTIKAL